MANFMARSFFVYCGNGKKQEVASQLAKLGAVSVEIARVVPAWKLIVNFERGWDQPIPAGIVLRADFLEARAGLRKEIGRILGVGHSNVRASLEAMPKGVDVPEVVGRPLPPIPKPPKFAADPESRNSQRRLRRLRLLGSKRQQ